MPWFKPRRKETSRADIIDGLLTLQQMLSGVAIFGGTGSGKTSGPGRVIAISALLHPDRPGFVVPCTVPSEGERWRGYCGFAGRSGDYKRITPTSGHRFDFLTFELSNPYGSVESTAQLFDMLVSANDREKSGGGENPFWPLYQQKITRMVIAALWYGVGKCSVEDMYQFLTDEAFRKKCLDQGMADGGLSVPDFALALYFWMKEFPATEPKTKSIGVTMLMNILTKFLSGPIANMVKGPSDITPDDVIDKGEVHVLDMPILQYGAPARFFQIIYKVCAQRACERRDMTKRPRTVIGWVDEPQHTFVQDFDTLFQATARQSGYASVFLCQNLPTLYSAMGGGDAAKQRILGFIGNHMTKIFCANADRETNEFASALMGNSLQFWPSGGGDSEPYSIVSDMMGTMRGHGGFSSHWHPDVPPEEFALLRKGGKPHCEVDAYLTQSGKVYDDGKPWRKIAFSQR